VAYREQEQKFPTRGGPTMPDDHQFSAHAFLRLPSQQRVHLCAQSAERAHNLANFAPQTEKRFYLEIAQQWLLVAEAILEEQSSRMGSKRSA